MSSLLTNLLRGSAALTAQSKGLEVTGRNLANVNTPGYARQTVQLSAGETMLGRQGPEAMAVRITGVTQARDIFLDRQVASEKSLTAAAGAEQDVFQQVQTALGQGIDTTGQSTGVDGISTGSGGLNGALSEFFNAFQALAADPSNATARETVIGNANALAGQVNLADQRLASLQSDTTEKIDADVTNVNRLLHGVADLNEKIARFEANSPDGALDLRDQRQAKLEELAGYMNFETRPSAAGQGQIQLSVRDTAGAEVTLVDKNRVPGPVSFDGTTFQAGTPAVALNLAGGSLPAQLDARDGLTQSVRNDLAKLAGQLRAAVNAAYNPGGAGSDFFVSGGGSLLAVAPGIDASTLSTTMTGNAGGNEIASAVAAVANQRFAVSGGDQIDGTLSGYFSKTVTRVGDAVKTSATALEDQQLTEGLARSRRDQVSGVSLDEETANLMKYQRAFQASARFVNVIDDMLDTIVNRLGKF